MKSVVIAIILLLIGNICHANIIGDTYDKAKKAWDTPKEIKQDLQELKETKDDMINTYKEVKKDIAETKDTIKSKFSKFMDLVFLLIYIFLITLPARLMLKVFNSEYLFVLKLEIRLLYLWYIMMYLKSP